MEGPVLEEPLPSGDDGPSVDDTLDTESLGVGEGLDGGQLDAPDPSAGGDGLGDGVFAGIFERPGEAERLVDRRARRDDDVGEGHAAGGDGAGLVEDDRVDPPGGLQDLGSLDEDAELGASTRADHEGGRCGEPEGAGAGDDEDGDPGRERGGGAVGGGGGEPEAEGGEGQGDHDRDEDGRHPVGEALHGGLAGLGVFDEAGDLGQGGVGADPGGAHDETPSRSRSSTRPPAATSREARRVSCAHAATRRCSATGMRQARRPGHLRRRMDAPGEVRKVEMRDPRVEILGLR